MHPFHRLALVALLITTAAPTAHAQTIGPPPGITLWPADPAHACRMVQLTTPAEIYLQGPLPDLSLQQPAMRDNRTLAIITGPPGAYNVWVFPDDGKPKIIGFTMQLAGQAPPPNPPPPTGPISILFTEDTANRPTLPAPQQAIPTDPALRDFLDAQAGFRIVDPRNDFAADTPAWRQAITAATKTPYTLTVFNNATLTAPIHSSPWPASPAATLALLRTFKPATDYPTRAQQPLDPAALLCIDDTNYKTQIGDKGTVLINGKPKQLGYKPRPKDRADAARLFSTPWTLPTVPRAEWSQRIKEGKGSWLSDLSRRYRTPVLDQDGLPYCHGFSPAAAIMALQGYQSGHAEIISGGSIGGPATGFVAEGAWIGDDLRVICELGAATTAFVPALAVTKKDWGNYEAGTKNALLHRVPIWRELAPRDFAQVMTCLFSRKPVCVGLNWWSHAVTYYDPCEPTPGTYGVIFRNSWGTDYGDDGWAVLAESKATPDEAYVPEQIYSLAL